MNVGAARLPVRPRLPLPSKTCLGAIPSPGFALVVIAPRYRPGPAAEDISIQRANCAQTEPGVATAANTTMDGRRWDRSGVQISAMIVAGALGGASPVASSRFGVVQGVDVRRNFGCRLAAGRTACQDAHGRDVISLAIFSICTSAFVLSPGENQDL